MSSLTVSVTGTDSANLVCNFFPPLELYGGDWYVGLMDFTTYNSIPNIIEGKNNILPVLVDDVWKNVNLPTGTYEITDIETYVNKQLGKAISLRPNNNTLKCELYSKYKIDFTQSPNNNIGRMLGFKNKQVLEAHKTHESDAPVDIIKVNTIQVQCNIVQGSYRNGEREHTLHSFYPTVEPGFKIVEIPKNVTYLQVNVQRVDNIILSLVDQDGDTVDFRGEIITVRLHLKRWDCILDQR